MLRRNGLGTKYLRAIMLHNIEDFCNKIISVADQAKRLKEESKSGHNAEIKNKIEDLQMQCRLIGNEGRTNDN